MAVLPAAPVVHPPAGRARHRPGGSGQRRTRRAVAAHGGQRPGRGGGATVPRGACSPLGHAPPRWPPGVLAPPGSGLRCLGCTHARTAGPPGRQFEGLCDSPEQRCLSLTPPGVGGRTTTGCIRYPGSLAVETGTSLAHSTPQPTMVLEIAHLTIRPGQNAAFEHAFAQAQQIIASMPGYLSHELGHCLERPQDYVLLVRWVTLEDHEIGFRQSARYQDWKQLLHHFYDPFPTVLHFGPVALPAPA